MFYPDTWSCWEPESLITILKVPQLAEVKITFYDEKYKRIYDQILWEHVQKLGERSIDGQYFDLTLKIDQSVFYFEFASCKDMFCARVVPESPYARYKLLIGGALRWNTEGTVIFDGERINIDVKGENFTIKTLNEHDRTAKINISHSCFVISLNKPVYIL